MFRMLKLAAYVLFGWFLYEAIKGISAPVKPRVNQRENRPEPRRAPLPEMRDEPVFDSSGARYMQKVGRGVLR